MSKNESYQFKLANRKKLLRPHPDPNKYLDRAPKGAKRSQKVQNKQSGNKQILQN